MLLEAVCRDKIVFEAPDARAKLRSHLSLFTEMAKENKRCGDTFRHLAHRGGILAIRAQMAWLNEVENTLIGTPVSSEAQSAS